jgi:hypothetical protein
VLLLLLLLLLPLLLLLVFVVMSGYGDCAMQVQAKFNLIVRQLRTREERRLTIMKHSAVNAGDV